MERENYNTELEDIISAYCDWSELFLGIKISEIKSFDLLKNDVRNSLKQQKLDGMLKFNQIFELQFISDLFINLIYNLSCNHYLGEYKPSKEIAISNLRDLYTFKTINRNLLIKIIKKL